MVFTGCSIEQRYHSEGFSVHWNSSVSVSSDAKFLHRPSVKPTKVSTVYSAAKKSYLDTAGKPQISEFLADYENMDVPMELLSGFSNQDKLFPYFKHDSVIRYHKVVSLYTKNKTFTGKLMGISESGVFIYNKHKPLTGFDKMKNGINQRGILGNLYYVPYSQISRIQKGGTFDYQLQRILEPFFQWVSLLVVAVLTIGTIIISAKSNNQLNLGDAFEVLVAIFMVIGIIVSVIFCLAITLLLTPPLLIWHTIVNHLPGRTWVIKGDPYRGEQFFRNMLKTPRVLRIFKK